MLWGWNKMVYYFCFMVVAIIAPCIIAEGILYPQDSESRDTKDLGGLWNFRIAPKLDPDKGFREKWFLQPLAASGEVMPMPVPSSYNDITQNQTIREHIGWAWYDTYLFVPRHWSNTSQHIFLRFGSVHYNTIVWLNNVKIMMHEGGHLPFQAEVSKYLNFSTENHLTVAVNNTLTPETIPQGEIHFFNDPAKYPPGYFVQTYYFDFFNYAGIHRRVVLFTTPKVYIDDITVVTNVQEKATGIVEYDVSVGPVALPPPGVTCYVELHDKHRNVVAKGTGLQGTLTVANASLWWPFTMSSQPGYLYTLKVKVTSSSGAEDVYRLRVGIRSVTWNSTSLMINKTPFYFRGFGRHEDYNIRGKGLDYPSIVKDFNLIKWTGANSFRTSHYPYAEELLDMADQEGIVIIDESPAIGLNHFDNQLLQNHLRVLHEFVQRDKNRPSVIMWSLGNEPISNIPKAGPYFKQVVAATRKLDPTRPLTVVLNTDYQDDQAAQYLDIICLNRYFAWYSDIGHLELIQRQMTNDLISWNHKFGRPVLISEYGAEAFVGLHASPPAVFSVDYQVAFLEEHFKAFDILRQKGFFIGEMIWNFADFMTPQEIRSFYGNKKGIFTRERQPKPSAYTVRARYWKLSNLLEGYYEPSNAEANTCSHQPDDSC